MIEETPQPPTVNIVPDLQIQAFTSLVIVVVIHPRRWRMMVVVMMMMVVTTRRYEHCHTRQNKSSELFLDRHLRLSSLDFHQELHTMFRGRMRPTHQT